MRVRRPSPLRPLLGVALASLWPCGPADAGTCLDGVYRGFDSRLEPEIVGRLPEGEDEVRDFEIVRGRPVVAMERRLLAFGDGILAAVPSLEPHAGLAVDAEGRLVVQSADRSSAVIDGVMTPLAASPRGRLHNSGSAAFLEAVGDGEATALYARRLDGEVLPLARVEGELRGLSWSAFGLAAVVDDSLLVWEDGAESMTEMLTDSGLRQVRDICQVGPKRVVVALDRAVFLATDRGTSAVVGLRARCAAESGRLYLLDEQTGLIWRVGGLSELGDPRADLAHAKKLVKGEPSSADEGSPPFLEAARIAGCEQVRAWRR